MLSYRYRRPLSQQTTSVNAMAPAPTPEDWERFVRALGYEIAHLAFKRAATTNPKGALRLAHLWLVIAAALQKESK